MLLSQSKGVFPVWSAVQNCFFSSSSALAMSWHYYSTSQEGVFPAWSAVQQDNNILPCLSCQNCFFPSSSPSALVMLWHYCSTSQEGVFPVWSAVQQDKQHPSLFKLTKTASFPPPPQLLQCYDTIAQPVKRKSFQFDLQFNRTNTILACLSSPKQLPFFLLLSSCHVMTLLFFGFVNHVRSLPQWRCGRGSPLATTLTGSFCLWP